MLKNKTKGIIKMKAKVTLSALLISAATLLTGCGGSQIADISSSAQPENSISQAVTSGASSEPEKSSDENASNRSEASSPYEKYLLQMVDAVGGVDYSFSQSDASGDITIKVSLNESFDRENGGSSKYMELKKNASSIQASYNTLGFQSVLYITFSYNSEKYLFTGYPNFTFDEKFENC